MSASEYVTTGAAVVEFGAGVSRGLKELRITHDKVILKTVMGGTYEYDRRDVRCIRYANRKWMFGKWFSFELNNGTRPDILFGGSASRTMAAFRERGWPVESELGTSKAD